MRRFLLLGFVLTQFLSSEAQSLTNGDEVSLFTGDFSTSYSHNAIGDIDGDGNLDYITESSSNNYLSTVMDIINSPVLTNHESVTGGGMNYYSIKLGDLDNDGDLDFITAGPNGATTSPNFVGYWDGTNSEFNSLGSTYSLFSTYFYGQSSLIGDFNNDGKNDVVWIATDGIYIALNSTEAGSYDANITFASITEISTSYISVTNNVGIAKGDFNNDGNLDFVVNGRIYNSTDQAYYGSYYLLLGNGDGTFATSYPVTDDGLSGIYVSAGDVDNDGYDEFVVIRNNYTSGAYASEMYLYSWNAEDSKPEGSLIYSDDSFYGRDVIMEDIDGDSDIDIIHRGEKGATAMVFLNDGNGNFNTSPDLSFSIGSTSISQIYVYDIDDDGLKDIVKFYNKEVSYFPIVYDQSTNISKVSASSVKVWPNPASQILNIDGVDESTVYQLYSITGSLVKGGEITNATIDISQLNEGIYLLNIDNENIKVIKQ